MTTSLVQTLNPRWTGVECTPDPPSENTGQVGPGTECGLTIWGLPWVGREYLNAEPHVPSTT